MKGRQAFTPVLTQAQLAQKTGKITAADVAKYERGELVPDQQTLSRMENVLGIKLRGKDIGLPTAKALKEKERAEKAAAGK
jgi:ribosome-binding protein aMBF1 (putative translation factor)